MRTPLWTLDDVIAATGGRPMGHPKAAAHGVAIDSRTLAEDDLFVAIKGDTHDGHAFVAAALAHGAAFAIVAEDQIARLSYDGRYVLTADPFEAMRRLGRAARARTAARVVAVTGSVGKTSTKEALRLVLGEQAPTHAAVASFNNHWGVPLTLARMPAASRYGVFEIGMNHAGEITPLVAMVRPHVAVVTTIAPVHLEHFPDGIEGIARAKAEIFSGLEADGTAVVNADVPEFPILKAAAAAAGARVVGFGEAPGADVRLLACEATDEGSRVEIDLAGRRLAYLVGAPGRHLAMNSLAVLAAVEALGADVDAAAASLAGYAPAKGRGARLTLALAGGEATLIDESYNANPVSMRAAIALLAAAPLGRGGRRIAVLGDMLELGPTGPELHAGLAEALVAAKVDVVHLAGPLMKHLHEALAPAMRGVWAPTSKEIEAALLADVRAGDAVMIKGSLGSRMGPLVEALKANAGGAAAA